MIKQTSNGQRSVENDDCNGKFSQMLLKLVFNLWAKSHLKQVYYNIYYPSIQTHLFKHPSNFCVLYFASYKAANQHNQQIYEKNKDTLAGTKIHPWRVTTRCTRQVLCLMDDDARWLDKKDILTNSSHLLNTI